MGEPSAASVALRSLIDVHRPEIDALFEHYGAINPRLFGSVARGDANEESDIDIWVDFTPIGRHPFLRVCGLGEELRELLGVKVDVVAESLLKRPVSESAIRDAVSF